MLDADQAVQGVTLAVDAAGEATLGLAILHRWSENEMQRMLAILLALRAVRALSVALPTRFYP
jgi:hypothetical protein